MINASIKPIYGNDLKKIQNTFKELGAKKAQSIMRGALMIAGNELRKNMAKDGANASGISLGDARRRIFRLPRQQPRYGWGKVRITINSWSDIIPASRWKVRKKKDGELSLKPKTATGAKPKWNGRRDRFQAKSKYVKSKYAPQVIVRAKNRQSDDITVQIDVSFAKEASRRAERHIKVAHVRLRKDILKRFDKIAQKGLR